MLRLEGVKQGSYCALALYAALFFRDVSVATAEHPFEEIAAHHWWAYIIISLLLPILGGLYLKGEKDS